MGALSIQVKELRREVDNLNETHAEAVTGFEAQIADLTEAKEQAEARIAEFAGTVESLTAEKEAFEAKVAELETKLTAKSEAHDDVVAELAEAKYMLVDPAFTDASVDGAEDGEAQSSEETVSLEAYKALSGVAKTEYWLAHKTELLSL